jgi:hypothetical protein
VVTVGWVPVGVIGVGAGDGDLTLINTTTSKITVIINTTTPTIIPIGGPLA